MVEARPIEYARKSAYTTPREDIAVRNRTVACGLVSMTIMVSVVADVWAGSPADQVRWQVDRVVRVLTDPQLKASGRERERRAAVQEVAGEMFDVAEMTRRTLGPHWRERTEAERAEIIGLFADLLERTYFIKIAAYNGEKITVVNDSIDGEYATVRTRIVTTQGTEIPVDYRMLRRGERWVAYDVSIEGVSLVGNYRAQFNTVIQRSSYRTLVDMLRSKAG
jgi:phospholipid transport system substrate-binding protein